MRMGVRVGLSERIKFAAEQSRKLREKGVQVVGWVLAESQEGFKELSQVGRRLKPVLRSVVSDSAAAVREWVDEANQFLADKAIPPYRKAQVAQKRLEEKLQQFGGAVADKVRPARKAAVDAEVPTEASPESQAQEAVAGKASQDSQEVEAGPNPEGGKKTARKGAATRKTVKAEDSTKATPKAPTRNSKGAAAGRAAKPKKATQPQGRKPQAQSKSTVKGTSVPKAAKVKLK